MVSRTLVPFSLLASLAVLPVAHAAPWSSPAPAYAVDRQLESAPGDLVRVELPTGIVNLVGTTDSTVRVVGTVGKGSGKFTFARQDTTVVVRVEVPLAPWDTHRVEESFLTVYLPRDRRLEVDTASAEVQGRQLTGSARLHTVSGNLTLQGMAGPLAIKTVSGEVGLEGTLPTLDLETVSGDVRVLLHAPRARASFTTVSGDVELEALQLEELAVQTVSGDVKVAADPGTGTGHRITTQSGDVTWKVPAQAGVTVVASSLSGDLEILGAEDDGHEPGRRARERQLGSGAARIQVTTTSGDVAVDAG